MQIDLTLKHFWTNVIQCIAIWRTAVAPLVFFSEETETPFSLPKPKSSEESIVFNFRLDI